MFYNIKMPFFGVLCCKTYKMDDCAIKLSVIFTLKFGTYY